MFWAPGNLEDTNIQTNVTPKTRLSFLTNTKTTWKAQTKTWKTNLLATAGLQQVFLLFPLPSRPSCVWKLEVVPMSIVDSIRVLLQMISEHRRYYTKMIFQSSPNVEKLLCLNNPQAKSWRKTTNMFFLKEEGKSRDWNSTRWTPECGRPARPWQRFLGHVTMSVCWEIFCQVGRTKCKDLSKLQGIQGCVPAKNLEKPYASCQNQREFRRWHVSSHTRYFCMAQGQRGSRV